MHAIDTTVKGLGECRHDSPLAELLYLRRSSHHWVDASDRVLLDDTAAMAARARRARSRSCPGFEAGGPRRKIFFDPSKTRVGIVTCGGLCPGLNNVIRGLVMELTRHYGVRRIIGFRNGYQGFIARYGYPVMDLDAGRRARHQRGRRHDPRQLARAARTRRRSSTASSSSGSTSCSSSAATARCTARRRSPT